MAWCSKVDGAVSIKGRMCGEKEGKGLKESTISTLAWSLGCCCTNAAPLSAYYMFYTK